MGKTRWVVILDGDDDALVLLAEYLTEPEATIERVDDRWYLTSSDFELITDPGLVEQNGADVIQAANAAVSLETAGFRPTAGVVAAVRHEEGSPIPQVIAPTTVEVRAKVGRPMILLDGELPNQSPNRVPSRIRLGLADDDVRQVFLYLDHPNVLWDGFYKIAEVIERSVGGIRAFRKRSWVKESEHNRFRQTTNHYRHAKDPKNNPLPDSPMTLGSARTYTRDLVHQWLLNEHGV